MVISSHLLDDLERVANHVCFEHGRIQLMGGRDELADALQLVLTDQPIQTQPGVLRTRKADANMWQSVIDTRSLPQSSIP